jgi:hypothetical protein
MESKKINQLATELAPDLSDLTIIGDPTTGISKKITLSQMASLFTGTVEEYANFAAFPLVGVADTIYIALDTNILYRWNTGTSAYVELSPNIVSSLVFNDANGFDGTINLVGSVATLTITTALTTGSVGFIGASGALLQDNANFFWDDTNNRLGLGTNAPTTALDVFGSGIIGRINGTSTNNAYLGFASAGTNKWSVGNVQSDHRFRIFSEANSAELISVLQTGEVGIGIANPLTKLHIDGGATALIANLDANVSVAKSISFRSDNSNRINLEVSGTESGSNAGADLFIKTFTDAGSLLATPLTITRSTSAITLAGALSGTSATFNSNVSIGGYLTGQGTNPGGLGGSRYILDWQGGRARIFSYGANSTTNGEFLFNSQRSDGTNSLDFLSFNIDGKSTFINALTVNYAAVDVELNIKNTQSAGTANLYLLANANGAGDIRFTRNSDNSIQGRISYNFTDGSMNFRTGGNDNRLVISSTGCVGIGHSAPDSFGSFSVRKATSISGSNVSASFSDAANSTFDIRHNVGASGNSVDLSAQSGILTLSAGSDERMRIISAGKVLIGTKIDPNSGLLISSQSANDWCIGARPTASSGAVYGYITEYVNQAPNSTTSYFYYGGDTTTQRYSVRANGGIYNFQANDSNLSDERTKKDILPLESYWNKFKAIEIVKFKYKDQTHDDFNIGVIAQQVEKVAPEFIDIDGWNNKPEFDEEGNEIINTEEPLKSVYTSDLHHATIKVLQEAMLKIEALEEEVKLLKAK